jgi:hypothetical protein
MDYILIKHFLMGFLLFDAWILKWEIYIKEKFVFSLSLSLIWENTFCLKILLYKFWQFCLLKSCIEILPIACKVGGIFIYLYLLYMPPLLPNTLNNLCNRWWVIPNWNNLNLKKPNLNSYKLWCLVKFICSFSFGPTLHSEECSVGVNVNWWVCLSWELHWEHFLF